MDGQQNNKMEQLKLLAESIVYLISLHALIPIAITAFGPCNITAILFFIILIAPWLLILFSNSFLKFMIIRRENRSRAIGYILLVLLFPFIFAYLIMLYIYSNSKNINLAVYIYFIAALITIHVVLFIYYMSSIASRGLYKLLLRRSATMESKPIRVEEFKLIKAIDMTLKTLWFILIFLVIGIYIIMLWVTFLNVCYP